MSSEPVELKLMATGEEQLTQALRKVIKEMSDLERAEKSAAREAAKLEQAQKKATKEALDAAKALEAQKATFASVSQGASKYQSTIAIAAGAVNQFSGSSGKMVSILGQTAGAMATVAGSMGPVGIAIVGVTSAVGLLSAAFADSKDEAADAKREMESMIPTLNEIISKMEAARSGMDLSARVRGGRGTILEQTAYQRQSEARLREDQKTLQGLETEYARKVSAVGGERVAAAYGVGTELGQLRVSVGIARSAVDESQRIVEAATTIREGLEAGAKLLRPDGSTSPAVNQPARRGGGSGPGPTNRFRAESRIVGVAGMADNGSLESLMSGAYGETGGLGDLTGGFKADQAAMEAQIKAEADARQKVTDAINEQKQAMDDLAFSAGTTAVDAFEMLASTAVSGGKISGKAFVAMAGGFLKATGQQMLGQGIKNQFEAAALLTNPVTASFGAALAGVASGQIATGAAMMAGGVVANIGAAAMGDGGGASVRGGGGGSTHGSFSPTAAGYGSDRDYQGPATIVVNLENSILANTYADAGKIINRAIREAELRYGRS